MERATSNVPLLERSKADIEAEMDEAENKKSSFFKANDKIKTEVKRLISKGENCTSKIEDAITEIKDLAKEQKKKEKKAEQKEKVRTDKLGGARKKFSSLTHVTPNTNTNTTPAGVGGAEGEVGGNEP
jgi:chromosome segregation ATPase